MPDAGAWIRRFVPADVRDRVFDPALADAARERRVRRRRARTIAARAGVEALYLFRSLAAARECRALARDGRRRYDPAGKPPSRNLMIKQDIVFAVRMLRKAPGFTLAAVLATALGIGANSAIFTVVKSVLLQPLPYPGAARIVNVDEAVGARSSSVSPPNFVDWRAQNRTLSALAAYNPATLTLSGGPEALRLDGVMIDAQVLTVLGVQPLLGRGFTEDDTRKGARAVALLGHALWQRVYGGDRAIVGRTITLEGAPYEVAGVMPPGFAFPDETEIWVPLTLTERDLSPNQRGAHYLTVVGRLRDGVTVAEAQQDLNRIEQAIAVQFPTKLAGYSMSVTSLLDSVIDQYRRPLWILFGAVGFVMLIACVNVSNLLLARATTRTGEIAVRTALGAGRGRLIRQLLAESIVLSLAGGVAGLLLGSWGVRALMAVAPPDLPRAAAVRMDVAVLAFSMLLSIVAGIVFGVAPAVVASRPDLSSFLKDVRRDGGSTGGRRRLRAVLVAAQVALALVLLTGAGLAARSFDRLTRVDPGFRTANVLTFEIVLPEATYGTMASITQFYREYLERVRQQPGITSAGAVSMPPLTRSGFGGTFTLIGRPESSNEGNAQVRSVTPGYMEALSIPLRAGRFLDARDSEAAPRVALVSETAARRFWPGENPVGQQIRVHVNESVRAPRDIVGVVADVRTRGLEVDPVPVVYVPHAQYGPETMTIVARTAGDPMQALPDLRAILKTVGPGVAIGSPHTAESLVSSSVAEPRFRTLLLTIFAVVSLALAALGLYGVVAFSVNQRRAELGLRIALGANPADVLRLVLREGMLPVAAGILCGLGGAAILASVMQSLLFHVDALDPMTFGGVALTLAAVALAACYMPARRAMRVDPAGTLR
jgi:putative ABC transport system permease protein